jgi:ribosomal protein S18 acetylase RimI-like enzyme
VSIELRDWHDADLEWWIRLRQGVDPSMSEELLRRIASGEHAPIPWRRVATVDGVPVGCAMIQSPAWIETSFFQAVVVAPDRGRGIGSALWRDALVEFPDTVFDANHPESSVASRPIVEHWGFVLTSHAIASELDAADFVPMPAPSREYVVSTKTSAELTDADIAVINRLLVASATHPEVVELGWPILLVADMQEMEPNLVWTTIRHEHDVVALSTAGDEGSNWHIHFTGVDPQHRGKGLGRAAKSALHEYGIAHGAKTFDTHNEERNEPMRALNRALGYRVVGGQYRYRRDPTTQT